MTGISPQPRMGHGGAQGWLFADGRDSVLAEQLFRRFSNRRLCKPCVAARQQAEARADWKKNFQVLLTAYERAVSLKRLR